MRWDVSIESSSLPCRVAMVKLHNMQQHTVHFSYAPPYLPFVWGIHQWATDSPHKGPVTWNLSVHRGDTTMAEMSATLAAVMKWPSTMVIRNLLVIHCWHDLLQYCDYKRSTTVVRGSSTMVISDLLQSWGTQAPWWLAIDCSHEAPKHHGDQRSTAVMRHPSTMVINNRLQSWGTQAPWWSTIGCSHEASKHHGD